jgi:hypothetical protein
MKKPNPNRIDIWVNLTELEALVELLEADHSAALANLRRDLRFNLNSWQPTKVLPFERPK